jgi:tyrosyl-tRNA synthetase
MAPANAASTLTALRRGVVEIISEADLTAKLALNRPLVVKAGFDPTAPDLHLGHTVLLRKLRQFQDLGHQVIFLIGDATALVGDPSGQSKMRKLMTPEQVHANAATYHAQVQRILEVASPKTYQQRYNSEWLGGEHSPRKQQPFGLKELVELTSKYTVARLIERDDFARRLKGGQEVSMLELFYPLMQGYDSVMLKADVELGGTDQKFNLLVGRDLQRAYGQPPQVVITMPLLEGTDGAQKMSKSLGNHIGINEPSSEMFGKLMSIPDTLIVKYATVLTNLSDAHVQAIEEQLSARSVNPRDLKAQVAEAIIAIYHGPVAAQEARRQFTSVFSKRELPSHIPIVRAESMQAAAQADGTLRLVDVLVGEGLADTKNEARRLISQRAVEIDGKKIEQPSVPRAEVLDKVLKVSRHFRRFPAD